VSAMTRLARGRAALLVIDVQDRLASAMPEAVLASVIKNTAILIEAAARFGMPVVVSQQYPQGLGSTVQPLEAALAKLDDRLHRFDKVVFSAAATDEFAKLAPALGRDLWIVAGMEAHVCVLQTVRDLATLSKQVYVPIDAICSRTKANWRVGIDLIGRTGALPTSTEVCVFDLLERAGGDDFKALSKAIK
jgi:nicotinamidase-related amidase